MPLTPIFLPQEDWYQAMVTKNKGSLKATNRQEEWYEEIVDSMASGGLPDTTSASAGDVLSLNNDNEAVWTTPSSGGGVLVVHDVEDVETGTRTLDKTWQEIYNAYPMVYIDYEGVKISIVCVAEFDGVYEVYTYDGETTLHYNTRHANEHPVISDA